MNTRPVPATERPIPATSMIAPIATAPPPPPPPLFCGLKFCWYCSGFCFGSIMSPMVSIVTQNRGPPSGDPLYWVGEARTDAARATPVAGDGDRLALRPARSGRGGLGLVARRPGHLPAAERHGAHAGGEPLHRPR